MREKALPTLIGIFVVGALILLVVGVAFYVTRTQLDQKASYILYFSGSLKGLHIGSPITYRGIKVGIVTKVKMEIDSVTNKIAIPVIVKFYRSIAATDLTQVRLNQMIQRGLRAKLEKESLLSGGLAIVLVKQPTSPIVYHQTRRNDKRYIEIPTVASSFSLDINKMINSMQTVISNIDAIVNSPEIKQILKNTTESSHNLSLLLQRSTNMVDKVNAKIQPVLKNTNHSIKKIDRFVYNLNNQLNPVMVRLNRALSESKEMMYTIRVLMDYLGQQPSALIVGKSKVKNTFKSRGKH